MSNFDDNKAQKLARLTNTKGTTLSRNVYNLVMGLTVLWGVLLNYVIASMFGEQIVNIDYRILLIGYLVTATIFTIVIYKSNVPIVSFLGFTGLASVMGVLVAYIVSFFNQVDIIHALVLTVIILGIMILLSCIFPSFFLSIGKTLGITLLIVIIVELISILFGFHSGIFDFIVVGLFCGYIGYDFAKAQVYPPTLDNAIDSAADIYVDIVNIFIRLLQIVGKNK